jgi:hypothetical protein
MEQERRQKERKRQKQELMLITPPPDWREYHDHYLGRRALLIDHHHALLSIEQFFPCQLVFAALCVHARRSLAPPPLPPPYTPPPLPPPHIQVHIPALQLQRFLRGCVLATARALVAPPACVVRPITKRRQIDCIFARVMSGFVARAEVRRQERTHTLGTLAALICWMIIVTLIHCAGNDAGYAGALRANAD